MGLGLLCDSCGYRKRVLQPSNITYTKTTGEEMLKALEHTNTHTHTPSIVYFQLPNTRFTCFT